jgi:hypothetical protein
MGLGFKAIFPTLMTIAQLNEITHESLQANVTD